MGTHDVDRALPYATVQDDELRIPLADLARFVLRETTPDELLSAVLQDDTARELWLEAVGRRYATPGLEDEDRRKLLGLLHAEVHDKALDGAVSALTTLERQAYSAIYTDERRRQFRYWLSAVRDTLEAFPDALLAVRSRNGFDTVWAEESDEAQRFKLFGADWLEAKAVWRKGMEERFPLTTAPASPGTDRPSQP